MELIENKSVIFTEEPHSYTLYDTDTFETRELSGVTSMIKKCVFPDLYKDVSEAVLAKAANHGSLCHKLCERYDNGELTLTDDGGYADKDGVVVVEGLAELSSYIDIIMEENINVCASEYLVSDNRDIASCIDKVVRVDDDTFDIIDLKFTYNFEEEYVRWQTSIYADMLEAQNPGAKVRKIWCMHIHNYPKDGVKAGLHELKRIDHEILENLKYCYLSGTTFVNPFARKDVEFSEDMLALEQEWYDTMKLADEYAKKKKSVMDGFKKMFDKTTDIKSYVGRLFTVSQGLASHSKVFDEERFKAEQPELYRRYCTKDKVTAGRTTVSYSKK